MGEDGGQGEGMEEEVGEGKEVGLSKNAMKRKRKMERMLIRKRERKMEEKRKKRIEVERRLKEREEKLSLMDPEEKEQLLAARVERMNNFRAQEKQVVLDTRKKMLESPQRVCIDLEWHTALTEKEISSLLVQLNYTYSAVRKAVSAGREGLHLFFSGVNGNLKDQFTTKVNGYKKWPVEWMETTLLDIFKEEKESLVYLTHESTTVLEKLDSSKVYVIGGIVDRNRLKGGTLNKAKKLDIPTARLNLNMDRFRFTKGTTVLTVNHVAEILLEVANGLAWDDALKKVLPERKCVMEKEDEVKRSEKVGGKTNTGLYSGVDVEGTETGTRADETAEDNVDMASEAQEEECTVFQIDAAAKGDVGRSIVEAIDRKVVAETAAVEKVVDTKAADGDVTAADQIDRNIVDRAAVDGDLLDGVINPHGEKEEDESKKY